MNRDFTRQLNPSADEQDAKALGSSIEFEVFQINETKSSHTFLSLVQAFAKVSTQD
ncbi:hypothetical protein GEW_00095 [Pasteurella multocida subsp. gallicida str. Anand1_poultry]|nr:hypothetical protein GEW_00095 [Pasteurella multocida subsp. gallicida str. Anand1_poultry]